jgi:hypothetical protein
MATRKQGKSGKKATDPASVGDGMKTTLVGKWDAATGTIIPARKPRSKGK